MLLFINKANKYKQFLTIQPTASISKTSISNKIKKPILRRQIMKTLPFKAAKLFIAINTILLTSATAYAVAGANTVNNTDGGMPTAEFDKINVISDSEYADGPVEGVAATQVISTTGISQSILKSTQSVSVVGQEEINAIGATDLNHALDYTSGVNRVGAQNKANEDYIIRGFRTLTPYRDGQKYRANLYNGQQELYGIDRIEVVKGPASMLSGTLPPGGVINAISKKPFFDNAYEVNAEVGRFDHRQVSTDLNHKVNDDVAVRLVGVYRDSDSFVDLVNDDRLYLAPSLTWRPSMDTTLTLKGEYQHDDTIYIPGLPYEGTVEATANGKIDRDVFSGVKGFDEYDNKTYSLGYELSHFINPDLEIRHKLQYMEADIAFPYTTLRDQVPGSKTKYARTIEKRQDDSDVLSANLSAAYYWDFNDNIENVTLLGVDYSNRNHATKRYNGTASSIDLFNPDHSQDVVDDLFVPYYTFSFEQEWKEKGIYLQNQTTVNDKWIGVIGVRHDKAEQDLSAIFIPYEQEGDYSETTGRIGLSYLMDNGVAPYASINQSFETSLGTDKNGNLFDPTTGTQYEIGVRYQPEDSDTLLTGSIFRIDQTDVLVADPDDIKYRKQLGEVRSEGIELEAKTKIGNNTNIIAAYAYTDARTIESSPATPQLDGQRTGNVPYNKFSLWGDYTFNDYNLPGLRLGAGLRYVGSAIGRINGKEYPSYTLVDAMASYEVDDNWTVSLNANNLFDKEYATCIGTCNYGEPRNVVGKVTYKW